VQISSLYIRVTDLQTSLAVAEQALKAANKTTAESQSHCLKTLENLGDAQRKIEILEARATNGEAEKLGLQQEVVILKGEVSRLQNGVEQITRFASSVGYLSFPVWLRILFSL
jgi:chromosome segregation ATPase